MRVTILLLTLVAFTIAAQVSGGEMPGDESSLQGLKSDLLSEKIKKVRVLFVPYEVVTRVRLTPELLQGTAEVNRLVEVDHTMRTRLLAAIGRTKASPLDSPPDLRWGAIFYDTHGVEVHSLYLNGKLLIGTGRRGIIDGNLVKLNGALVEWFEETFENLTQAPVRRK